MADSAETEMISSAEAEKRVARSARLLAVLGTVPFILLAVWLYAIAPDHPWRAGTVQLLAVWSGLFLTFLGGIRWGVAMRDSSPSAGSDLLLSVLPLGFGCAALAAPMPYSFAALAAIFAALGAWDTYASHEGSAPRWYGRLRSWQTVLIVAAMILAFAATG
jgi:hypothetical protein